MNKLSVVIPNRSRNLDIVSRSLKSIHEQWVAGVEVIVVDYGSELDYQEQLQLIIDQYDHINLILCRTQGQLWNKSRCINVVLQQCESKYFMVCDMDMIWHPRALEQLLDHANDHVNYYQVGFLDQDTTATFHDFKSAQESFKSTAEATGISVFPVQVLKEINGFDEFYHGWGSEDTDAHLRCKNAGYEVRFRESEILFKHQWHEKSYRVLNHIAPLHTQLEQINSEYLKSKEVLGTVHANRRFSSGLVAELPDQIDPIAVDVDTHKSRLFATLQSISEHRGYYKLQVHPMTLTLKQKMKSVKHPNKYESYTMEQANNLLLEWIINHHRDAPYHYSFDHKKIVLSINLSL